MQHKRLRSEEPLTQHTGPLRAGARPHLKPEQGNGRHADDEQDGDADQHLGQRHLAGGDSSGRRLRPPGCRFSEFEGGDQGGDNHHHHHGPGQTHPVHHGIQVGEERLDQGQKKIRSDQIILLSQLRNYNVVCDE